MMNYGVLFMNLVRSTGVALLVVQSSQGGTSYYREGPCLATSACTHCGSRVACSVGDFA
jgi:hypothetical protein